MYDIEKLELAEVVYTDQLDELYNAINNSNIAQSPFADKTPTKEYLEDKILADSILFFNVHYESVLTGYILLEFRSQRTADFHWGVTSKNKYLPKIIEDAFKKCCALELDTFIGWTPASNKMARKIAIDRIGFEEITVIDNYFTDGDGVMLSKYINKR